MTQTAPRHPAGGDWYHLLVPVGIIRFALFAPLGIYWASSTNHWNLVHAHDQLQTYDPKIASGAHLASEWSTFAFFWNIAVWLPSFWFPPPLNLPFTAVDLVITIYVSWATSYQTQYVPHIETSCAKAAYIRPAGANESFFEAAGRLNGTATTGGNMCKSFVQEWQYGVAISFFYALIVLFGLMAFFGALRDTRRQGKTTIDMLMALCKSALNCLTAIPRGIATLLLLLLWFFPQCIFRCLPISLKAKVRFGRRYALKSVWGLEQKAELEVTELKDMYKQNQRKQLPRYKGGPGEACPLSDFLGVYDMLMAVTEDMHYLDVMTLSRVSKSVREVVLPAHDFDRRIRTFRRYTCPGKEKMECWICDKQICTDCQHRPQIPQTTLLHHSQNCLPSCTKCFQALVVSRYQPHRQRPPHCRCAPITAHPNPFLRLIHTSKFYKSSQDKIPKVERAVCRDCNVHSVEELLAIREKSTKLELKRGVHHCGEKWTKCGRCKDELGTGPRWWVCGTPACGKECRSVVHKGWGRAKESERTVSEDVV
ncbi:hypothetical protein HBI56_086840 [Parastagonospora nodorum]|uniref:F-box domain-containing protein n=1 Tax=Phaeosphaeria nodorum (strain SN15 / ATCC MYA-4574 / FGSC 10173) TaxID=321614 RepID=A0A7U2FDX8_PHANO|nr:hypothetical protein HBH56_112640 [Parastagonospora nodorum]QRD03518.1 hypothetical protein JI435_102930 [Parastagonospora nodorum SN15]KAH3925447.1 hypothetical protein HBH54_177710 [Parastagonospora nodorum]KAH3951091.1 hypothetical protein HBH53_068310 [Parastagonospora nodorum]KAH3974135.1 hypothetical protein HBH51_089920 [Parastagonospora nodorum]